MSTADHIDLVLKYLQEKYPDTYEDMTAQKIRMQPYHKLIWALWKAKAHYKLDGNFERLEDAPEGLRHIWVMGKTRMNCDWIKGQYVLLQEWDEEFCKSVYGDKTPGTY